MISDSFSLINVLYGNLGNIIIDHFEESCGLKMATIDYVSKKSQKALW